MVHLYSQHEDCGNIVFNVPAGSTRTEQSTLYLPIMKLEARLHGIYLLERSVTDDPELLLSPYLLEDFENQRLSNRSTAALCIQIEL